MHLKRLDLQGFKTFADRITLEFGPGITAIVGPNGSGKSNLADAILWALGEQSMKALRSQRAHDVIFAGADGRRPAGMAQVSLTLDNSDGQLALDFPEVTLTRRVMRSGEGEYMVNRVPCRLRDIHELVADTGMGKRAYSVVTQSEVDAVLSVRGEDRRALLEEAAGIHKYRQRREEAERRLSGARANLLRVSDILAELEAQLEPLEGQSAQARRHRELSAEIRKLRLALMVAQREELLASGERLAERQSQAEAEAAGKRAELADLGKSVV